MPDALCQVTVQGVAADRLGYDFILLAAEDGRQLPIWVGSCDAQNVLRIFLEIEEQRPLTHRLIISCFEHLGGRITGVTLDDLWQNVFYAKVHLTDRHGTPHQLDCRPADALAIALRLGLPIQVREDVLEEGKIATDLPTSEDTEEPEGDEPDGDEAT